MDFCPTLFAITSAREAFDQHKEYNGVGNAIMAYIVNVRDTLSEYDRLDALNESIFVFCREIAELSSPKPPFVVIYHHLTDASEHKITCDNVEDAQLVWDSLVYLRNHYLVKSSRPA